MPMGSAPLPALAGEFSTNGGIPTVWMAECRKENIEESNAT